MGKSTLFNAVTRTRNAEAANYPFCTIDANQGVVTVPDERLGVLSEMSGSQKVIPAAIEFVDIAGLVEGASAGAGLGNKFLATIRLKRQSRRRVGRGEEPPEEPEVDYEEEVGLPSTRIRERRQGLSERRRLARQARAEGGGVPRRASSRRHNR